MELTLSSISERPSGSLSAYLRVAGLRTLGPVPTSRGVAVSVPQGRWPAYLRVVGSVPPQDVSRSAPTPHPLRLRHLPGGRTPRRRFAPFKCACACEGRVGVGSTRAAYLGSFTGTRASRPLQRARQQDAVRPVIAGRAGGQDVIRRSQTIADALGHSNARAIEETARAQIAEPTAVRRGVTG